MSGKEKKSNPSKNIPKNKVLLVFILLMYSSSCALLLKRSNRILKHGGFANESNVRRSYILSMKDSEQWSGVVYSDLIKRKQKNNVCKIKDSYCDADKLRSKLIEKYQSRAKLTISVLESIQKIQEVLKDINNKGEFYHSIMSKFPEFLNEKGFNRNGSQNQLSIFEGSQSNSHLLGISSTHSDSADVLPLRSENNTRGKKIISDIKIILEDLFEKNNPLEWLKDYQKKCQVCLKTQIKLIADSTCRVCSSNNAKLYTKSGKFNIEMSTCTNLLEDCAFHWKNTKKLEIAFKQIMMHLSHKDTDHIKQMVEGISKKKEFWEQIKSYSGNSDTDGNKLICEYFFNVLDYAPKIQKVDKDKIKKEVTDRLDSGSGCKTIIDKNLPLQAFTPSFQHKRYRFGQIFNSAHLIEQFRYRILQQTESGANIFDESNTGIPGLNHNFVNFDDGCNLIEISGHLP